MESSHGSTEWTFDLRGRGARWPAAAAARDQAAVDSLTLRCRDTIEHFSQWSLAKISPGFFPSPFVDILNFPPQ
ncbi:hypothetical protein EYF80_027569 [Liparis tanakae]|uniref:Uncharacterized protein n=1 Tax=Liparis tanakae TaxID=230148 RepID=A0A4Z2H8P0_9TELE|nr:hypothetical protein EYF80_027569 [Liparis tanakae]